MQRISLPALCIQLMFGMAATADPPALKTGAWRAWLESPGGELPFGLVLVQEGETWKAFIVNVLESIPVPRVAFSDDELVLDIDYYDSRITAKPNADGTELTGEWKKTTKGGGKATMKFRARAGHARRFAPDPQAGEASSADVVEGRWSAKFEKDLSPAVAVFKKEDSGAITGTFLTPSGDYRYLAGNLDGKRLRLSTFDGAHAFLFDARLQADGTLKGDFWSRDAHHETWIARRDPDAKLPEGLKRESEPRRLVLADLRFPDLDGKVRSLADPAFQGKVRLLEVFGSWCPNCHDATKYLAELDQKYRSRGLSIVGLAFEFTGEAKRDAAQVKTFAKHHGVEYPVLLAGIPDKEKTAAALPFLGGVSAYPTTIFLDGEGRLRAVHTGFSGPATGVEHQKLRTEFEKLIEELLGESKPVP